MSKIGRKPIEIPEDVVVQLEDRTIKVRGPLGELALDFREEVELEIKDKEITVSLRKGSKASNFWGLTRSLVQNIIIGVKDGFTKELEVDGVGYKFELSGQKLVLNVGFSHPVEFELPDGVKAELDKNVLKLFAIDKALVGQTAAEIRAIKKPEPYKGKGVHYVGEIIRRKEGKKAAGEGTEG